MNLNSKNILYRTVFFVGWVLSPFTFWNDVFVNIPIAYICANLFVRAFPAPFIVTLIVFYWLSNAIGILMMFFSGRSIFKDMATRRRELIKLAVTIVLYSALLIILHKIGILKEF